MRRALANLALAGCSLVLFLALAEGLCRTFDLRPGLGGALANPPWLGERWLLHRDDYRERLAEAGFLGRYYDLYAWDRFTFYRLRPDRHLELIDPLAPPELRERTRWSVHTSSAGFRTDEFEAAPAPDRTRIVTLGDSSTFGWGVESFQAYPEQLAHALAERTGRPAESFEIINLGIPGYSTFQGRVLLERFALDLSPDVVTWSYLSNDGAPTGAADQASYERRLGPTGALLEWLHRSRAYETLEAWIAALRRRLRPAAPPDPRDPGARNIADLGEAERNVRGAVASARAAGVPLVLVGNCVRPPSSLVLDRVAASTGTPFVDGASLLDEALPRIATEEAFKRERADLLRTWGRERIAQGPYLLAFLPDGCHPNFLGHRLVAQAVADAVVELLPAREG